MIVIALLMLLAMVDSNRESVMSSPNLWAEPARGILAQHCGQCHLPNLPTSVPRALSVFNLSEDPWYGRLTHDQLDDLLHRVRAVKALPEPDLAIVERFVSCARDQVCPPAEP